MDLDNNIAKMSTKANLDANDLAGQIISVGSNPAKGNKTYLILL